MKLSEIEKLRKLLAGHVSLRPEECEAAAAALKILHDQHHALGLAADVIGFVTGGREQERARKAVESALALVR